MRTRILGLVVGASSLVTVGVRAGLEGAGGAAPSAAAPAATQAATPAATPGAAQAAPPAPAEPATFEERVSALEKEIQDLKALKLADPGTFRAYWKDGLAFDSVDGKFKLTVGGRIQNDWAWHSLDDDLEAEVGPADDGTEFRRARIALAGTAYGNFEYKAEYDFAGGESAFKDVYLGMTGLPGVGGIRVGHFKEPMGLEELTSSNYITFMERSVTSQFLPVRNTGAMAHNLMGSLLWQVGVFRDVDDFGDGQSDGDYNATARLAGAPVNADKGRTLVHLGGSYSYRRPNDEMLRFRERPEAHLAPRFVDTGTFEADEENRLGAELAAVLGPLSLQGELLYSRPNVTGDNPGFHAWYVMASFFLTGEHRPYRANIGAFDRVRPNHNFWDGDGGLGAWELAARLSRIDLTDEEIDGGEMTDLTLGVNWYLNPCYRVMLNYVYSDVASLDDAHIAQMRFQVAF
jgi:phosphate-selective porin OprO/OprP